MPQSSHLLQTVHTKQPAETVAPRSSQQIRKHPQVGQQLTVILSSRACMAARQALSAQPKAVSAPAVI